MVVRMFTNNLIPSLVLLSTIWQCTIAQATVGDSCTVISTNLPGTCKFTSDCPEVEEDKSGINPTICGFYELTLIPIVCCENANFVLTREKFFLNLANGTDSLDSEQESLFPDRSITLSKSERKCQEYTKSLTGVVEAKCDYNGVALIVGGEPASAAEFPFMAAIGFCVDNTVEWKCGGTLVSDFYVLTAAQCTFSREDGVAKTVRLGDLDLSRSDDNSVHADYNIHSIIVHPNYRYPQKYNDIALIRLSSKVQFTKYIRPACLHTSPDIDRTEVLATGWGKTDAATRAISSRLRRVSLYIYPNQMCSKVYHNNTYVPQGITSSMMCAVEVKGGADSCQGDSGGPLLITKNGNQCKFYIVAVTAFGKSGCQANTPAVYTKVSVFVPWIEKTIW